MSKGIQSSSEWVSLGHPDRLSDLIAAIIINDIQKKDGYNSHAAVEVFLTHDKAIISGEVTTTLELSDEYLRSVLKQAYHMAGYIDEMRHYWSKKEVMLADDMEVINLIQAQSPDIALGTTDKGKKSGWNDVGIMFSSSENTNSRRLGVPMLLATLIGEELHKISKESIETGASIMLGPDIKVVVTCNTEDAFHCNRVDAITISQSHSKTTSADALHPFVKKVAINAIKNSGLKNMVIDEDCKWVINGTGQFTVMGNVSDTSMTGRKISVNHPSAGPVYCNKMIGGGSLVKCYHASDFILNVAARFVANVITRSGLADYCVVGLSCAIGRNELQSMFIYANADPRMIQDIKRFFEDSIDWSVHGLTELFKIMSCDFSFSDVVAHNFFGHPEASQTWEGDLVGTYAWGLRDYLQAKVSTQR